MLVLKRYENNVTVLSHDLLELLLGLHLCHILVRQDILGSSSRILNHLLMSLLSNHIGDLYMPTPKTSVWLHHLLDVSHTVLPFYVCHFSLVIDNLKILLSLWVVDNLVYYFLWLVLKLVIELLNLLLELLFLLLTKAPNDLLLNRRFTIKKQTFNIYPEPSKDIINRPLLSKRLKFL